MTTRARTLLPLPDPPEREPEDMTSFQHLAKNGNVHHLIQHFGSPGTTIIEGERFLIGEPGAPASERTVPDLMVAFGADPERCREDNGYVISRQGKPPDFVMEIASRRTGERDLEVKRPRYASLGIPEYWRFDETGEFHGSKLTGDRLAGGGYEPILIEAVEDGVLQGYSAVLDLFIRWERGELRWHDPKTGRHIATFEQERDGRMVEHEGRLAAEARVRELEAEMARRDRDE